MAAREPLAIVGMACRFPGGASGLDKFWQLLENGVDAICEVPRGRWDSRKFYSPNPNKPGKAYVNQGGFLQEPIDEFDPLFFHMSPRETESLDPQQRILLEVTFESVEDAGIPLAALEGARTGVFIGGFCLDANHLHLSHLNRESIDSHTATSSSMAMMANRVSYIFNLQGPSVTVDTACSSSLVATHLACQSLWNGECEVAIAGGTNVMLRPETPVTMSKGRFLSPDGRCMTFDKRANGYVRAEGAGAVILKTLSQARRDNDRIYAQVLATGINQDGRTGGITFPNGESQQALMRRVYSIAGVQPRDIDYIEAHGTGTQAGDVTEAGALHKVLSEGRTEGQKAIVGSVKSNVGHMEAAAGIAGVIKTALCLDRQTIAPNLHFHDPNPEIPFDDYCIRVPTEREQWPQTGGKPRMAAINSFGYGGTNAHVLLQEAPPTASGARRTQSEGDADERIVCLSANGEAALKELARKYVNWLKEFGGTVAFDDLVYSMNHRRSHLDNRLVVRVRSADDLQGKLREYAKHGFADGVVEGVVDPGQIVFVYTGMGPQWWGMGRQLFEAEPVFAEKLRECDVIFREIAGWSLLDEIRKDEHSSAINQTHIAQPANFAIQAALTELWRQWGIVPDVVVGHSVGEVAAAHVSGALDLRDGLTVSFHRSRLQATTAGSGTMLAVGLNAEEAARRIESLNRQQTQVSIAAINSPTSVTLAGEAEALQACAEELKAEGIFTQFLRVDVPYHSHKMDPLEKELLDSLSAITPGETRIPLYSTVSGSLVYGRELHAEYWWHNVRQPVRFGEAVSNLLEAGHRHFVEVGPHPVLRPSIREGLSLSGKKGYTVQSLNRKIPDERGTLLDSLGTLHALGIEIDLNRWSPPDSSYVKLPGYAWQRDKYWRESEASRQERLGNPGPAWFHSKLNLFQPAWEVELNSQFFPYLDDHVVQGNVVFPGAAYVEAGLELNRKLTEHASCMLENVSFLNMLAVADDKVQKIQLHYDEKSRYYSVHSSLTADHDQWAINARGKIVPQEVASLMGSRSLDELKARCSTLLDPAQQYETLKSRGLEYGPGFRTIREWRKGDQEVLARLELAERLRGELEPTPLHATLLDGAFQSLVALFDGDDSGSSSFVPVEIERLLLFAPVPSTCWVHARIRSTTEILIEGDIDILGPSGEVLATLERVKCKAIAGASKQTPIEDCRYSVNWVGTEDLEPSAFNDVFGESWLIFARTAEDCPWIERFNRMGIEHTLVFPGDLPQHTNGNAVALNPHSPDDFERLLREHLAANVLYLWHQGLDGDLPVDERITEMLWPLNQLANAAHRAELERLRITVVVRGSQQVLKTDVDLQPSAAVFHGLLPLVSNEYRNIKTYLIDADCKSDADSVFRDIVIKTAETSVAWRDDHRFVKRLERQLDAADEAGDLKVVSTAETNLELRISKPGSLESLEFIEKERRAPGPGEIEIQVYAASLNFKDLLKVYGQLADNVIEDTYFGNSLGMELSGVVVRVGEGVDEFKVGDDVAGPIRGSFCSYATVPTTYVIHRPKPLSFNEVPVYIGYLAAFRGLVHCADLQEGEKILIHNATGGVGIAAMQIARWKNAEIYATAGTKEKREWLREQGVEHIYDSRSLLFVEQILRDTEGYGVDVVINAIAGDALYKSFNLLAPYGRFIEIGKKDIGEDNGLPMRAFNRNITFTAVDMDRMLVDRVPIVQQILRDISTNFESGIFEAVPISVFKASEAKDAFSAMAQSKHMGKVVLEFKDDQIPVNPLQKEDRLLDAGGSYVVTGGTSGFGLHVADWLVSQGAGRLYLVSRSGIKTDEDRKLVEAMQRKCDVEVRALDVSNRNAVAEIFAEIRESDRPLKGIIHGAMVLDDGFLSDMTPERYRRVLAPKAAGACNLHEASLGDAPDFFVMFSSVASVVGNTGQANYVAANSFLDGFAHFRRSLGLPATTINWGVLGEAGVVARNADVGDVLEASGMKPFTNKQALEGLRMAIEQQPVQIGLFDIDWARVNTSFPALAASATFKDLIAREGSGSANSRVRDELLAVLLPLSPEDRQREIENRLLETMSAILKIPANRIDARKNIADLGIDSLVAVELTVALQKELSVEITTVDLLGKPSVGDLAAMLLAQLITDEDELLANLDELSEEELDKLLATASEPEFMSS